MSSSELEVARQWATEHRPGAGVWQLTHPDFPRAWHIRLALDGAGAEDQPVDPATAWRAVSDRLRAGGTAEVVVVGSGGRTGLGRAKMRQALAWLSLDDPALRPAVGVRWLEAPPEQKYRSWALPYGVSFSGDPWMTPAQPAAREAATASAVRGDLKIASKPWHIRPGEDALVHEYWSSRGGHLWCEVGLPNDLSRPIDAVWISGAQHAFHGRKLDFSLVREQEIVVIEAKRGIKIDNGQTRGTIDNVLGQVLTAQSAVAEVLQRPVSQVGALVLVDDRPSPLPEVFEALGVSLEAPTPSTIISLGLCSTDGDLADWLQEQADALGEQPAEVLRRMLREAVG